jgi:hypothetical protein
VFGLRCLPGAAVFPAHQPNRADGTPATASQAARAWPLLSDPSGIAEKAQSSTPSRCATLLRISDFTPIVNHLHICFLALLVNKPTLPTLLSPCNENSLVHHSALQKLGSIATIYGPSGRDYLEPTSVSPRHMVETQEQPRRPGTSTSAAEASRQLNMPLR